MSVPGMKDPVKNRIFRIFLIITGIIMLILGFIGLLLPVMPTTPFLLVAAFLFARSSERFYTWLVENRYFGKYIKDYRERRGMRWWVKILTIMALWISITSSALLFVSDFYVRAAMFLIAALVTIHILMIRTLK